jgi:membrane-associated phospholipid phosphatase
MATNLVASRRPLTPLIGRLATFTWWGSLVGIAFFVVYPTTNWLASLRNEHYSLYVVGELSMPFVPEFVWFYFSMYGLFLLPPFLLNPEELKRLAKELILATGVAGLVFVAFPARLGFARTLPEDELYRAIFEGLFTVDHPFNLVPSLHVVYTTAIGLAVVFHIRSGTRVLLCCWWGAIVSSTVLVHQHHLLDVVTGVALAVFMHSFMGGRK